MNRVIENIFFIIFVFSIIISTTFISFYITRSYENYFNYIIYLIFFSALISYFIFNKKVISIYIISIFLIFISANAIYKKNVFSLKLWFNQSVELVKYTKIGNTIHAFLKKPNKEIIEKENNLIAHLLEQNKINNLDKDILINIDELRPIVLTSNNKIKILDGRFHEDFLVLNFDNKKKIITYYESQFLKKVQLDNNYNFKKFIWIKYFYNGDGFHHWGSVKNNLIYAPNSKMKKIFNESNFQKFYKCENIRDDLVSIFNFKNGDYVDQISIYDVINELFKNYPYLNRIKFNNDYEKIPCDDPYHLNDIIIVDEFEKNIKNINEGDILLSLRNLNLLVIIDKSTRNIKWFFQGEMKLQHSPRILRNGFIIVLDNQGSDKENGRSRIVSINMETKSVESIYEAKNNDYFETMWRGRLQIFDNSIFVQEHDSGRIIHLKCKNALERLDCNQSTFLDLNKMWGHQFEILF